MKPQRDGASEAPADNPSGRPLPTGHIRWLDVCRLGHASARSVPQAPSRWLSSFALAGFLALIALLGFLTSPVSAQTLSDDANLSDLALSPGRLEPAFASGTTEYSAGVGYTITQITVTPNQSDSAASVAFLNAGDLALPDGDMLTDGHQVDLVVGENVFKVRVMAEDSLTTMTYVVTVTRTDEDRSLSPAASDPPSAFASSAVYRVTFTAAWTSSVTPDGLPGGAHFSPLIGAVHNANVTFVEGGGTASAGVESMAELGGTAGLEAEVTAAADALSVLKGSGNISPTSTQSLTATLTSDHPRVTLLTMVAPSPDWFVGVSGLLLVSEQGHWLRSHEVALYPWDAGTEDGGEFSLTNDATVPPGAITSIRGTGKFSTEPIASLSFTLESVSTTRSVDENTEAGVDIGAPVAATAVDGVVTYTLGGTDAASFDVVAATGQLQTKAALDYETKSSYEVTVTATDTDGSTTTMVTINVANVIELTTFSGPTMVTFAENGATRVATFSYSSDEDRDGIEWVMAGVDRGLFSLDSPSGALRFLQAPDFENPLDVGPPGRGTNNIYELKLVAWARDNDQIFTDEVDVMVTVTDVDEAGALSLSPTRPALGAVLTAVLTDPDGVTDGTTSWRWERNTGREGWTVISGATTASYTPTAADGDRYLRATATYTDSFGANKTAEATAPHVVIAHRLSALAVPGLSGVTGDDRAFYPVFAPDTLHYAARCTESVTLTLTTENADVRLSVNGVQRPKGEAFTVDGLGGESDIRITLTDGTGASTTYVVHCLDGPPFPKLTTVKATGALEDLLVFNTRSNSVPNWLMMVDNNGVPRLRYRVEDAVGAFFRAHPDETRPHARYSFEKRGSSFARDGAEMVVLDSYFNVLDDDIHVKAPYNGTNPHDQQVTAGGNYVLMAYSSHQHNLRFLQTAFPDLRNNNGDMLSENESVRDGVIQVQKPDGTVLFDWNSWDHMAIEDCIGSPEFRAEYAHINSLGLINGDIIAGFRQCSKILRIDGDTGDVIWRAGPSILTREQWEAGETLQPDRGGAPLDFINDPRGGFSGQHGGHMTYEGNLLVYDNASHCQHPPGVPTDAKGVTQCSGERTRAVEYALDTANGEMVFLREFIMPPTDPPRVEGGPGGHTEPMDNGDWLVSWSNTAISGTPMPNTAMHVDARTGTAKLTFTMHIGSGPDAGDPARARVTVISPVALAPQPVPLTAEFPASDHTSLFNTGAGDPPKVVVAFNQPVVDFSAASPSLSVTGATVASVSAHVVAGEPAHAYLVTLTPDGDGAISFRLVTGQACGDGGICTADGTTLSDVPAALVIGPPVSASFVQSTHGVREGATVPVAVRLSAAHQGVRGVTVAILISGGTASEADYEVATDVTFEAGETQQTVSFAANDDDLVEGPEIVEFAFGTPPAGVTIGATGATTVTLADDDPAQIDFTVATSEVAEGGDTTFTFVFVQAVAFERDQTIDLAVGGSATAGDDFTVVNASNRTLTAPYAITFPAASSAVDATIRVVDDSEAESAVEMITLSATLASTNASLGSRTVTIPPSDVPDTPVVTIAQHGTVSEGQDAAFTLSRTDAQNVPLTSTLTVRVEVSATGSTLGGSRPGTATFAAGSRNATLAVATLDDTVVEEAGTVTALVRASTSNPPVYLTGAANHDMVTVNDNDVAAFTLSADATEVGEGGKVRITITADGVTFAAPQPLTFTLGGTTTAEEDFSLSNDRGEALTSPYDITLPAGARSVSVMIMAVTDSEDDADETIEVSVSHKGSGIGSVTITITEAPIVLPPVITTTVTTGGGGGGGGAPPVPIPSDADFDWNVTRDIESLDRDNDLPTDIWSDGKTLWVVENSASGADRVFAYDLQTGERQPDAEFELDRRNRFSHGIWSDGKIVWIADSGQDMLFAYNLATGERLEERDIELAERNRDPRGIWSDGETLYVLDSVKDALFVYDFETGELRAEYPLDKLNKSPRGIWSDGVMLWVSDDGAKRLFAYRIEDGTLVRHEDEEFTFRSLLKAGNGDARGIWSDGDVVYVADEQDDKVYSYNIPDAIDARLATLSLSGVEIDEFSPVRLTYTALADTGATVTTVKALATQEAATVVIEPSDTDGDAENGHQLALGAETEISITVTSSDGSRVKSYRVLVEKPPCLPGLTTERLSEVTFVGGSVDELDRCAREQGVVALFHWTGESWLLYAPDAPEFLSRPFNQYFSNGVPAGAPLIAVSNGQHGTDN